MDDVNSELILVGYTNGLQIIYAKDNDLGGQGSFYRDTEHNCAIPVYMLKTHLHRIETTSNGYVSSKMVDKFFGGEQ